jgi:hypothetical protein
MITGEFERCLISQINLLGDSSKFGFATRYCYGINFIVPVHTHTSEDLAELYSRAEHVDQGCPHQYYGIQIRSPAVWNNKLGSGMKAKVESDYSALHLTTKV